jgi:hypothetical protein
MATTLPKTSTQDEEDNDTPNLTKERAKSAKIIRESGENSRKNFLFKSGRTPSSSKMQLTQEDIRQGNMSLGTFLRQTKSSTSITTSPMSPPPNNGKRFARSTEITSPSTPLTKIPQSTSQPNLATPELTEEPKTGRKPSMFAFTGLNKKKKDQEDQLDIVRNDDTPAIVSTGTPKRPEPLPITPTKTEGSEISVTTEEPPPRPLPRKTTTQHDRRTNVSKALYTIILLCQIFQEIISTEVSYIGQLTTVVEVIAWCIFIIDLK